MAEGLTCTESEELLALAALGVLTRAEGEPLDEHLRGCAPCRRSASSYLQAAAALPSSLNTPDPPPTLRRNLLRAVYGSDEPRGERPLGPWAPLRNALTRRRVFEIAGAAVTLAAVIVAIVAVTRPSAPQQQVYTIVGTTSAPGVEGTLTYDPPSEQAVMTVTGLRQPAVSAAAAPQVYEVWLVSDSGATDGVAFLSQSPVNHAWSTVIHADLTQYVAVAATAEPYGGSPKPTSPQLLSVQLTR